MSTGLDPVQASGDGSSNLRVDVVTGQAGAEALVPLWDDLVGRSGSSAWVTPAWMLGWWRTYRPSARLRIVTVFEGDELVAVGPFCEVGPPALRLIRFLGQMHQPNRIVTAPGKEAAAGAVWDEFLGRGSALDLFDIEDGLGSGYRRLVEDPRWSVFDEPADSTVRIVVEGSADEYMTSRGGLIKDLQRKRRKMARDGHTLTVVGGDTPTEIARLSPEVTSVVVAAQRDRFKPGELEDLSKGSVPGTIAAMARAGRVHLTLLRIDERPAAFEFALLGAGSIHCHLTAYDSEWQTYMPGILCLEEVFRWAVGRGAAEFDLGIGVGAYKRRWSDDVCHTRRVVAAPTSAHLAWARAGMSLRGHVLGLQRRLTRHPNEVEAS